MIQKIFKDTFIKNNVIFFIGSMIAALLNYLYHPIMSRMMSVEDFGEMQTLLSITYLTGIFLAICGIITTNIIVNCTEDSFLKCEIFISQLFKGILPIVLVGVVGIVVFSPFLMSFLKFDSVVPFMPVAFILLINAVYTFYNAYLRGVKQFFTLSVIGIISSAGRLIFGIIFVYMGMRVFGAISALALATLFALLYAIYQIQGKFKLSLKEKALFSPEIKKEFSYAILILYALGYITFLYASDIILVKYFFDPEVAGFYSGISTIARIIFFATASVAGVLMPSIQINAGILKNKIILQKALLINAFIGFCLLGIFMIAPVQIISLMIGERYESLSYLLPLAGLYFFLVSMLNVLYVYFIALRDRRLIKVSCVGLLATLLLVACFHSSLQIILYDYIVGVLITMCILSLSMLCQCDNEVES